LQAKRVNEKKQKEAKKVRKKAKKQKEAKKRGNMSETKLLFYLLHVL
jgi:hypothetical protein